MDCSVFPPDCRILAAVSGGGDSVALFWWLRQNGFDFAVGHVHHDLHELRGGACADDSLFVRQLCARAEIDFFERQLELPRKNGRVNEGVAREARYDALLEMARESGTSVVATAHTGDDLLEGAILNLMRGAGRGGWSGFSPVRELGEKTVLTRPFWNVTRAELRHFLREIGEEWREDQSNRAPEFTRNRVRNEVLPLLSEISGRESPVLARGFAQNAGIARQENEFLESLARAALESARVWPCASKNLALHAAPFRQLAVPLQRRVLRLAATEIVPGARDISFEKIETLRLACIENQKRQVFCWRGDLRAEWTGEMSGNRIRFWRP